MWMPPTSWVFWEAQMNKRLLFCVETTRHADTDYAYIKETIRHYYEETRRIAYRAVYMESKTRYNSRAVREEIRRKSGSADTKVIYCIDTDDADVSQETKTMLNRIRQYCDTNKYEFIFFCKDVEDVYCGNSVTDSQKIPAIKKFKSSHAIEKMKTVNLESEQARRHCSNILTILDQYLTRRNG